MGDSREMAHKWLNAGGKGVIGAFDDYNHDEIFPPHPGEQEELVNDNYTFPPGEV